MLNEQNVLTELENQLSAEQLRVPLNRATLGQYLKKLNQGHDFDSDLTDQLFTKMQAESETGRPNMELFPFIFIEAFEALDRKVDLQEEHIDTLNQKIERNSIGIEQFENEQRLGRLHPKMQASAL